MSNQFNHAMDLRDRKLFDTAYFETISPDVTRETVIAKLNDPSNDDPFTDQEIAFIMPPAGTSMLIRLFVPFTYKKKSDSKIFIPEEVAKNRQVSEESASQYGRVIAMGTECFTGEGFHNGPWCKLGDWVTYDKFQMYRLPHIRNVGYGVIYDNKPRAIVASELMAYIAANWGI